MEGRPTKARRVVTACRECHRRKQKCDRERPCNMCVARKVPGKCHYDAQSAPNQAIHERASYGNEARFNTIFDATPASQNDQMILELPDQVGYFSAGPNLALAGMQKSTAGEEPYPARSRTPLRPEVKDKYIDLLAILPSNEVVEGLVNNFFLEANWFFMVLEPHYFKAKLNQWLDLGGYPSKLEVDQIPPELHYFPALLFQVSAVSLQILPLGTDFAKSNALSDFAACDRLSEEYSSAGMEVARLLGKRTSSIDAVQYNLLRCVYLKNCSRGAESWHSLGDSIRQAQDLGLHLQSPVPQVPGDLRETLKRLWYDEYKRRVWVTLFTWDGHMSLMLGRPRAINVGDCTIRTPLDCNIPNDPSTAVPALPNTDEEPSSYSAHIFHYNLALVVHKLFSQGANRRHIKDYGIITNLHEQVTLLIDGLPPAARPSNPDISWDIHCPHLPKQRQHISNMANAFLIALHRPHVVEHAASREVATRAALDLLDGQHQFFNMVEEHQHRFYSMSFHTINAAIFLCGLAVEHPSESPLLLERIQSALRQAIARLTVLQQRSSMAKSGLQYLRTCYEKISPAPQIDPSLLEMANSLSDPSSFSATQVSQPRPSRSSESGGFQRVQYHDSSDTTSNTNLNSHPLLKAHESYAQPELDFSDFTEEAFPALLPFWDTALEMGPTLNLDPTVSLSEWSSLLG